MWVSSNISVDQLLVCEVGEGLKVTIQNALCATFLIIIKVSQTIRVGVTGRYTKYALA